MSNKIELKKRLCKICKEEKDISEFYKTKYRCKECMKPIYTKDNNKAKAWKQKEKQIEDMLENYSCMYI